MLTTLIDQLQCDKSINNCDLLVSALNDLNNSIGNTDLKASIADQVYQSIKNGTLLNTILSGPLGSGKSFIAKKLALIYYALGLVTTPELTVVTRADFVDRYVGWTIGKTNKLLELHTGKVILIEDAYSLINGPYDDFGIEAVTALNLFMKSPQGRQTVIILSGYDDLLESMLNYHTELKERFLWHIKCKGYNADELYQLFKQQLSEHHWKLSDEEGVIDLFQKNKDAFPAYGCDVERLCFYSQIGHARDLINNKIGTANVLELKHIIYGINELRSRKLNSDVQNPIMKMMQDCKKNASQISVS